MPLLPVDADYKPILAYPLVGEYRCPTCGRVIGELREKNGRAWLVRHYHWWGMDVPIMDEYVQTTCPYCQRLVKFKAYEV
jgi:DNA-directed RNA polymerase subunit RPC12/RpoP